jgi:hypothetical protein
MDTRKSRAVGYHGPHIVLTPAEALRCASALARADDEQALAIRRKVAIAVSPEFVDMHEPL